MDHAVAVCPALLIAAPASGQGKTTVTAALARLHTRQGRRVRVFKCGPDFLDPHWHTLASGHPVHNLDLWLNGEADIRARLFEAASSCDLILIEGVMGLFDGEPSAADLAQRLGLPVLAVIDASAMAGTFGALAFGLQHFRPGLPWAGVLANRVAGERHAGMLASALGAGPDGAAASSWLGAVMRDARFSLPERHLGLTVAAELPDALARLDAAADALAETLRRGAAAVLARSNAPNLMTYHLGGGNPTDRHAAARWLQPMLGKVDDACLLLTEGAAQWAAAGLPREATPDLPPDADCIDFLFFVHDRHSGNKAAAIKYLEWETNLVTQIDERERASYRFAP